MIRLGEFIRSDKLAFALRLLLAAMILVAAVPKFQDVEKYSVYMIYSYRVFPMQPVNIARFLGLMAPWLELLIALGLLFGVLTRLSAFGWGAMSVVYFLVKAHIIFIQGRIVPCGCFPSVLPEMLVTQSIWIDVFTIPLCAQVYFAKGEFLAVKALLPERWKEKLRLIW